MDFKEALDRIRLVAQSLDDDDPDKVEMLNIEGNYSELMDWAIKKRTQNLHIEKANNDLGMLYIARANRFAAKAAAVKDIIAHIMVCAGEKSYKGDFGTVTKKNNPPKPIVTDAEKVPDQYKKKVIDKTAINEAIKNGEIIEGVSMDNGSESITIRVK